MKNPVTRALMALAIVLCLAPAPALAQIAQAYQSTVSNRVVNIPVTPTNPLPVTAGTGTSATQVQGNVASGAADGSTLPVKIGGRFNTIIPTVTDGQRVDLQATNRGILMSNLVGAGGSGVADTGSAGTDSLASANNGLLVNSRDYLSNGSSWDRAFTCTSSAVVNVTAAATTQIVALSGSTQVRVCSIAISMSAAGTAKFVYGTGANCVTGTTDLTAAFTLATGTPLQISAPSGGSLFRGAAANALCVTAVTGNVVGFITYAQF